MNRLILTADPEAGSVTLFEPDFEVGSRVQIMARDNAVMLDSVRRGVNAANEIIRHGDTAFSSISTAPGGLAFEAAPRARRRAWWSTALTKVRLWSGSTPASR